MDRVRAYVFTGQDLCTSEQGSLRIINKVQVKQNNVIFQHIYIGHVIFQRGLTKQE